MEHEKEGQDKMSWLSFLFLKKFLRQTEKKIKRRK